MKVVAYIFCFCFVMCSNANQLIAQDSAALRSYEELQQSVINDSVTQALELDNEEVNDGVEQQRKWLQEMVDEQAKKEPLYAEKHLDTTKWKKLIKDEKLNYDPVKIKKEEPIKDTKPPFTIDPKKWRNAMVILLFVMVALAIVLIIYAFFGKQYFAKPEQVLEQPQDNWEDVEAFSAWDKAIADALANNDYRLATRILYLQSLQQLNDANWIQYSKEKLSNHYLQKLYGTQLYQPFAACNRYFDYVWYGKYPLTQQTFTDIKAQFIQLQNQIGAA